MNTEPKIDVLLTCHEALGTLAVEDKKWVIAQLSSRIGAPAKSVVPPKTTVAKTSEPLDDGGDETGTTSLADSNNGDFAELFSKANPKTEDKKVLFASWLLFGRNSVQDFKGVEVGKKLKDTGHAVNNLSVSFGRLMKLKPQLVVQVGRGGNAKQSRKSYRLTSEGCKAAEKMLTSPDNEDTD